MFESVWQRFEMDKISNPEVRLPLIDIEDVDHMFNMKPTVINEQIDLINSRHLSTMDLASKTRGDVKELSEKSKKEIEFTKSAHEAILGSGILYGYLIADASSEGGEAFSEPDSTVVDSIKNLVDGDDQLSNSFAELREAELDHFGSDILSIALSSAQDHILDVAGEGGLADQSQVIFYGGVLIGAMARMPSPDGKNKIELRDTFNPNLIDRYIPYPMQNSNSYRYNHIDIVRDLENSLRIRRSGNVLEFINSRFIQAAPNVQFMHGINEARLDEDRLSLVITGKALESKGEYALKAHKRLETINRDDSIVGVIAKTDEGNFKKSKNSLLTAYNTGHPYYDRLCEFASSNVGRIDYIGSHDQYDRDMRLTNPIKTMGSVIVFEQIIFPDAKQTAVLLGVLGVLALGQKMFNNIVETDL